MKRKFAWFLALVLLSALLGGCAASFPKNASMVSDYAAPEPAPMEAPAAMVEEKMMQAPESGWDNGTTVEQQTRDMGGYKIIKSAELTLESKEFDADLAYIRDKANAMGGYLSSSYVSGRKPELYSDSGRYASLVVRIPQERMDAFLADARGLATVLSESTGGEDITSAYFDTESRLAVYTAQRTRILKLLETAELMEDIIALEQEHARLTYEIENLTTQVKRWDDLVDFATVTIGINEVPPASATASEDSFGARVSDGLQRTFSGMSVFFEGLVVFLIVMSPVLVLIALVILVIVLIRRSRRKRGIMPKSNAKRKRGRKHYYENEGNPPQENAPEQDDPQQ